MTMIEKVARAILDKMELTDGLNIEAATEYAKVAIEAMKEPTEGMLYIIEPSDDPGIYGIYTAMINKALEE